MDKEERKIMGKTLLLSAIVGVATFLISLIFLFFFDSISWSIGIAIGVVLELINIYLLYAGTHVIEKTKKPLMTLVFYMLRMLVVGIGVVITVLLGFGIKGFVNPINEFHYSVFGLLIGYTPLQIIVSIIELKRKTK